MKEEVVPEELLAGMITLNRSLASCSWPAWRTSGESSSRPRRATPERRQRHWNTSPYSIHWKKTSGAAGLPRRKSVRKGVGRRFPSWTPWRRGWKACSTGVRRTTCWERRWTMPISCGRGSGDIPMTADTCLTTTRWSGDKGLPSWAGRTTFSARPMREPWTTRSYTPCWEVARLSM